MKKILIVLTASLFLSLAFSQPCVIYINGIGCPYCAKVDPILLDYALKGKVIVIEYEIYKKPENSQIALNYWQKYNVPSFSYGIPFVFFSSQEYLVGYAPILQNLESYLLKYNESICLLLDGIKRFEEIDLNSLPGKPSIWYKDMIIVKGNTYLTNEIIRKFFEDLESIKNLLSESSEKCFEYSYGKKCFEKAYSFYDWKIYYLPINESSSNFSNYFTIILLILIVIIAFVFYKKFKK